MSGRRAVVCDSRVPAGMVAVCAAALHACAPSGCDVVCPSSSRQDSKSYLKKLLTEHGHYSVYGGCHATFLISGITSESVTELVAHKEAHIARLTTSNTKAMSRPHYRLMPGMEIAPADAAAAATAVRVRCGTRAGLWPPLSSIVATCCGDCYVLAIVYGATLNVVHGWVRCSCLISNMCASCTVLLVLPCTVVCRV